MELHENLLWLCGIASPSGGESKLADELNQRLAALSLPAPIRRYDHSLVVPISRDTRGPKIALVGQLDVADAGQPGPPRLEGDSVIGAGTADAKSGLCLMLDLAERPPTLHADLTLVFHARGELGFDGSALGPVLRKDSELAKTELALVLKPSDNKLQLGSGGSTQATLAVRGRTAHSGLIRAGDNAIHKFAGVLNRLATYEPVADVVDGLTWYESICATSVHGGRGGSVVPDDLEVNAHHTFGPSTSSHDSQDKLMALMDRVGAVRFEELSRSAAPNRAHPLIRSLEQSGVLGVEARQTWTEVARFTALGIAAATFGPGAERAAHSRTESIEVSQLALARGILDRWFAGMR